MKLEEILDKGFKKLNFSYIQLDVYEKKLLNGTYKRLLYNKNGKPNGEIVCTYIYNPETKRSEEVSPFPPMR